MQKIFLDQKNLKKNQDWLGNNIAVTCPVCGKVYLASYFLNRNKGRDCPGCGKSKAFVGKKGEPAWIEQK